MRLFMISIFLLVITGCTTALWSPHRVEENIRGFHINQELNELFVVGSGHGYIFPVDNTLKEIVMISRSVNFTPHFGGFELDRKNVITGNIRLYASSDRLSVDQYIKLLALGFEHSVPGGLSLEYNYKLSGLRAPQNDRIPLQYLKREHLVSIARPDKPIETAKKIVATPAAIIYDAVILVPVMFFALSVIYIETLVSGSP